ncbi:MAG TPA: glycerol-3-phosphate dehydrogenase/oxidase [Actinomycetota bacterium]|nr:glycerol-3-phosphate dehydrogenase/oxidase [Actinomycetota bacterium]
MSLGTRTAALERLASTTPEHPLDVLVVGGGITGAGTALDAAARGLRVGLVEKRDFASGTSSKSSKLVHGGLRYLEQREFGLMREASTERDLLRRLAPHLVEPIPFVLPVSDRLRRAMFGVGLWAYDALATFRNLKIHRHLDENETKMLVPALRTSKVRGGYLFYDCKTDDVRLVMEVLVQARRYGAAVANYAEVRSLEGSEQVCRADVADTVGGTTFPVFARRIIVAAGVWTDDVERLADPTLDPRVRPSKGVHLVFRRDVLPMAEAAAFIPDAERKRMLFVIPWLDAVLVGTTDTPYDGDINTPSVDEVDRRYCLDALNKTFGLSLDEGDIASAYAGLRPLLAGKADVTADLSRRHDIYGIAPGITGITGGKLTTYRRMARDVVDKVSEEIAGPSRSKTKWIRLGSSNVNTLTHAVRGRARKLGILEDAASNLVRCYGDRALDILEIARSEDLAGPLAPGCIPLAAEGIYGARHEMVTTLNDLLARRTRLALTDHAAGDGTGSLASELLSRELGWKGKERRAQSAEHRRVIEAERGTPLAQGATKRSRRPSPRATAG